MTNLLIRALKAKKIKQYQRKLKKIKKKITRLEAAECNWDEEVSPFLLIDKYKIKFLKIHKKMAKISDSSTLTNMKQSHINLKKHNAGTGYDVIDYAINKFLRENKHDSEFSPVYSEFFSLIQEVNRKNDLHIDNQTIFHLAKRTYTKIVKVIKARRQKILANNMIILSKVTF